MEFTDIDDIDDIDDIGERSDIHNQGDNSNRSCKPGEIGKPDKRD